MEMQQTMISFAPNKMEQQPTLKQRWQECVNSVNLWLNAKSLFYSNICQYSVSRRTVLRVNMVTAAMLVGAVCVEQEPVVAVVAMAVAAWLTAALKRQSN
ncbi:Tat pathway signal protein [Prevotella sp. SGI.027]